MLSLWRTVSCLADYQTNRHLQWGDPRAAEGERVGRGKLLLRALQAGEACGALGTAHYRGPPAQQEAANLHNSKVGQYV
eukprot:4622871-Pyramimonas_sp.AAC.1